MNQKLFYIFLTILFPVLAIGQSGNVQNASIPKDAPVNVKMTDFKGNVLPNEIVIFRSSVNNREFQGLTDSSGKFSIRLPAGDKYEIYVLGFKDSTSYNVLDIPATKGNAYYKNPFNVNIQHLPAKGFILADCNFETGKAALETESYSVIDELVAYLQRKEDERIELGGHTDNVGNAKSNLVLSEARANTVRDYLLARGIDPSRVTAKGYGLSVPIANNKTAEGRAQNRRTEVKILDDQAISGQVITKLSDKPAGKGMIRMIQRDGVYSLPCKMNDLKLSFIYDPGATDVSISFTEAFFMLKNGYLKPSDIVGKAANASGDISEGTTINIRSLEIAGIKVNNVQATVTNNLKAPLLLGQAALSKFGKYTFDFKNDTLTIGE